MWQHIVTAEGVGARMEFLTDGICTVPIVPRFRLIKGLKITQLDEAELYHNWYSADSKGWDFHGMVQLHKATSLGKINHSDFCLSWRQITVHTLIAQFV